MEQLFFFGNILFILLVRRESQFEGRVRQPMQTIMAADGSSGNASVFCAILRSFAILYLCVVYKTRLDTWHTWLSKSSELTPTPHEAMNKDLSYTHER